MAGRREPAAAAFATVNQWGSTAAGVAEAATRSLAALQLSSAAGDPVRGLGVLAAYETQVAAVAATRAAGLRRHYGRDGPGVAFWEVHADLEADHADWTASALAAAAASPAQVTSAAADGARAWWQFLTNARPRRRSPAARSPRRGPHRPAAPWRLPRDALGGEVLLVGGAPRVPIKIRPEGMVMRGACG